MVVPDVDGLSDATKAAKLTGGKSEAAVEVLDVLKKAKSFGKANQPLNVTKGANRSPAGKKDTAKGLDDGESCPSGSAFYSCANGFKGCCSVDPCSPDGSCPGGTTSSTTATSTASLMTTGTSSITSTTQTSSQASISSTSTTATSTASISSTSTSNTTDSVSTTPSSTTESQHDTPLTAVSNTTSATTSTSFTFATSSNSVTSLATPAPACPAGNNTLYTDIDKIQYTVHCNADNSFQSNGNVTVGTGGYGECFSACSATSTCAGFTYVGLDSGDCYLKQQMPAASYVGKSGRNYISCSKVIATAAASAMTAQSSNGKKGTTGAIVGGVIGGVAILALVLVLVALFTRRRRKQLEERRATGTHVFHGPVEAVDMTQSSPLSGHTRSGSTAHDAFAPYGGSYSTPTHTRQRSFYRGSDSMAADQQAAREAEKERKASHFVPDRPPPSLPLGARTEGGTGVLPAAVYQRPGVTGNPSADTVPMLDGTPVKRPASQASSSRSPRFIEHLAEMEDTSISPCPGIAGGQRYSTVESTDSPTLGRASEGSFCRSGPSVADELRRRQHLMSWSTYNSGGRGIAGRGEGTEATIAPRRPPTQRVEGQVSPKSNSGTIDSRFVVSPMANVDYGRPAWR
ncbi:hypothetical protein BAUCODRAFT_158899 [Baudoinia panamericana UAMH 10762]|uniref:Apple domain-containing protein n=1 Tax=Baudoinia panamericana (strain UAMH 10762) TaxID=717646 RepID=M2MNW7_BAUPA|nr:uncharacterized protein BAUCODRAFT_158899 [Baudoinia panamericana UAMH 10762]EMC93143.1 hypothetical protein BAUCODRAFT_158899 [Baudoinia panamericana UAMH 10762]